MNIKTTIVLLVLLLGVGATLFFTRDKSDGTAPTPVEHDLLDVKAADVTKVSIVAADGKKIVAVKAADAAGGSVWTLTEPVHAATDTYKVASLVSQLTGLRATASVEAADAANTGVDKPQYTVTLTAGAKDYTLKVGDKLAIGDSVYVRVGDAKGADVVSSSIADALGRPASELRKSTLFDTTSAAVQQIEVTKKDGTELLLQKQAKGWQVLKPTTMPADQYAAEDLIGSVLSMQPVQFVDDPTTAVGLKKPAYTVQFSTQSPTTMPTGAMNGGQTVVFGGFDSVEKKNVFAQLPDGSMLTVAATVVDGLNKKPLELRDKTVLDVDPEKVTGIRIATSQPATTQPAATPAVNTVVALSRRKAEVMMGPAQPTTGPSTTQASTAPAATSKWVVDSAAKVEGDDVKVDALLAQLHPLKTEKYEETAPVAKAVKTVTLTITTSDGKPPTVVTLADTGLEQALSGLFGGLRFDAPRPLETGLAGDFKKSSAAPVVPSPTPSLGGGARDKF